MLDKAVQKHAQSQNSFPATIPLKCGRMVNSAIIRENIRAISLRKEKYINI
jgi:hypothetical protein